MLVALNLINYYNLQSVDVETSLLKLPIYFCSKKNEKQNYFLMQKLHFVRGNSIQDIYFKSLYSGTTSPFSSASTESSVVTLGTTHTNSILPIRETLNEIGKQINDKMLYYSNQLISETKMSEQELVDEFPILTKEEPSYEEFTISKEGPKKLPNKVLDSFQFIFLFLHLSFAFNHHISHPSYLPLCVNTFQYLNSLKLLFHYFKFSNTIVNSLQSSDISKTTNQNTLMKINDKTLLSLFHLHTLYLRLLSQEFASFTGDISSYYFINRSLNPSAHCILKSCDSLNTYLSVGSITSNKCWKLANEISSLCGTIETIKIINKWIESTSENPLNISKKVMEIICTNHWELKKRGQVMIESSHLCGKNLLGSQLYLFEGCLLVFSNQKNGDMIFKEWIPSNKIVLSDIKKYFFIGKETELFEMKISSLENTSCHVKIISNEDEIKEWKSQINYIRKGDINFTSNTRGSLLQGKRLRKSSIQTKRETINLGSTDSYTNGKVENISINIGLTSQLLEMIQIGFNCNPFKVENKENDCVNCMNSIIKLLDKKKKLFGKEIINHFKDLRSKSPDKVKEVISLVLRDKSITPDSIIIAELILLVINDLRLYLNESATKKVSNEIKEVYEVFSCYFGDKSMAPVLESIVENYGAIITESFSVIDSFILHPLLFHKIEHAHIISSLGSMVVVFDRLGNVQFRNPEGDIRTSFKLSQPVFQVCTSKDSLIGVSTNKIFFMNMSGILREIPMICQKVYSGYNKIYILADKELKVFDSSFLLLNSIPLEIDAAIMEINSLDTLCICGKQNGINKMILINSLLEIISNDEIPRNDSVTSICCAREYLYIGTINGMLLKYRGNLLVDEKELKCGKISSIETFSRTIFVFAKDLPLIVLYDKGLTILSIGEMWGFNDCYTTKTQTDKRLVYTQSSPDTILESTRKRVSSSKSITNSLIKKERKCNFWIISNDGNVGKFSTNNVHHRKEDMLTETYKFYKTEHFHHWTINNTTHYTLCDICHQRIKSNCFSCIHCNLTVHTYCVYPLQFQQYCTK
ncbi:hypothetical protein EDI_016320 [Entamoeba dispar SAW760]|uniref:Phorbol-ester/DAG-type domain-containing protein n=1 Tax=Entamoeba dispar (strain ATCC PRA-260 / SAW760) TaxID=370354 RepID=B0ENM3_ENTDS|nr:uncharacterized protein EDI_016320 [Entamoeba dispar SAW760]EDR23850.1 hypothetical protein EDI_016320 [Entamoeba dispar SAW760]|eukprot:EDR23850.1 hypothetical protein EDI_016320 [Entamoeba dispar SAW760]